MTIDEILAERNEYAKRTGKYYSYGQYYGLFVSGRPKEVRSTHTEKYSHRVYRGISGTARIARKFNDEELEQIKAEYLAGATTTAIAEKFGSTGPTVRKKLKEMGVFDKCRDSGYAWTHEADEQLRNLYLRGMTAPEIAVAMNRSSHAVYTRISHTGIRKLKKRMQKEKPL